MVVLNHLISALMSPHSLGLVSLAAAVWFKRRFFAALAVAWLWIWSTGFLTSVLGLFLEGEYPPSAIAEYPEGDAIVCLGGGMGGGEGNVMYPEMALSADRVWHAARLWRNGKAPVVVCTSKFTPFHTASLLGDFGVDTNAVVCLEAPRNTEEEARDVRRWLDAAAAGRRGEGGKARLLLVTSAWHMKRSMMLFGKELKDVVEITPVPCDYEATALYAPPKSISVSDFWPDPSRLMLNSSYFKELYASWGYRLLRGCP